MMLISQFLLFDSSLISFSYLYSFLEYTHTEVSTVTILRIDKKNTDFVRFVSRLRFDQKIKRKEGKKKEKKRYTSVCNLFLSTNDVFEHLVIH